MNRSFAPRMALLAAVAGIAGFACMQEYDLGTAPVIVVQSEPDRAAGMGGTLSQFMSTALQPADWQYRFFTNNAQNQATLDSLGSKHILVQLIDGGAIPLVPSDGGTRSKADWNFDELNDILRAVLQVADKDPMIQIGAAPNVATMFADNRQLPLPQAFAEYCQDLVAYYNEDGFDWGNDHIARPSDWPARKIAYWGILSDINAKPGALVGAQLGTQYGELYATVTSAMQARSSIPLHFSALEFNLYGGSPNGSLTSGTPSVLDAFLGAVADAGPINDVAVHFFGTTQGGAAAPPDSTLFNNVRTFTDNIAALHLKLQQERPDAAPPIWVTENNVQADVPDQNGNSTNNIGAPPFVNDPRGTSPFFTAWRPFAFSLLGKAGSNALYHWDFTAGRCAPPNDSYCSMVPGTTELSPVDLDTQNAEVDFSTGNRYLSYWVDQWLGQLFPADPPLTLLKTSDYDAKSVEILATRNDQEKTAVVMVVDIATQSTTDVNGAGAPETVVIDVSALGTLAGAERLTIDATTDPDAGPGRPQPITPTSRMVVTLHGYGVAFLILHLK